MASVQTLERCESLCKYYRGGHCKFGEACRKSHQIETCSNFPCRNEVCDKRHPPLCRFYLRFGRCKYQSNCSYLHQTGLFGTMTEEFEQVRNEMNVLKAQNDVLHSEVIKLQNEVSNLRRISNGVTSDVNKVTNVALSASFGTLSEGQQVPVNCIRYEMGCRNIIRSYYTEYTAIYEPCSTFLKKN